MKILLSLTLSLITISMASANEHNYQLQQLRCKASNGVTLETVGRFKTKNVEGLEVMSKLGNSSLNFVAQLPVISFGAPTSIVLSPLKWGPTYLVRTQLADQTKKAQRVTGYLQTLVTPLYAQTIATVDCFIRLQTK